MSSPVVHKELKKKRNWRFAKLCFLLLNFERFNLSNRFLRNKITYIFQRRRCTILMVTNKAKLLHFLLMLRHLVQHMEKEVGRVQEELTQHPHYRQSCMQNPASFQTLKLAVSAADNMEQVMASTVEALQHLCRR